MRRILYYSLLCLLWVSVNSCKDDEAAQPPTPSLSVDKTTGLYQNTEFTFTIEKVDAATVSLLPYGVDHPNDAGIVVPASAFEDGQATVTFKYGKVGTFNAVVVANNHSGDGMSVKNAVSSPVTITITSDQAALTEFSFDGSTETEIDEDAKTINVTVPYGTDVETLKAIFKASDHAAVTVGGAAQEAFVTVQNFTSDVVYTVTSQDGSESNDYTVHVDVTPIQTDNKLKSFQGLIAKKGGTAGRVLPAYINDVNHEIVLYDTLHLIADYEPASEYDSVALDFAVNGSFAYARWADNNHLAGKDTVDFNDEVKFFVVPQDSTGAVGPSEGLVEYEVFVTQAPKLHVKFPAPLNPVVSGSSNGDFAVTMNVLDNTVLTAIFTEFTFDLPANTTITQVSVSDDNNGDITDASDPFSLTLDYTESVKLMVTVSTTGIPDYVVTYTIAANKL